MADVVLRTGGVEYSGWKELAATRAMEQCAGGFELSVSELSPDVGTWLIRPGDACEVLLRGQVVVSGYVDEVEVDVDATKHEVKISGRDRTGDLVDCSAVHPGGQWRGRTVLQIANDLAKPFGVTVREGSPQIAGAPLATFALQEGETAFEAIDRLARMRGLLLVSDGRGDLVLDRVGTKRAPTELVLGGNVLACSSRFDMRDRFSTYVVRGQAAVPYFEQAGAVQPKQYSQMRAQATDPGVKRYRPMQLMAEAPDVAATLQQRVNWEASVRRARSVEVNVTVQGWEHALGLWEPNRIVRARLPLLRIDDDMLIKAVRFELSAAGTLTHLALTLKDAFDVLPLKVPSAQAAASGAYFEIKGPKK